MDLRRQRRSSCYGLKTVGGLKIKGLRFLFELRAHMKRLEKFEKQMKKNKLKKSKKKMNNANRVTNLEGEVSQWVTNCGGWSLLMRSWLFSFGVRRMVVLERWGAARIILF